MSGLLIATGPLHRFLLEIVDLVGEIEEEESTLA